MRCPCVARGVLWAVVVGLAPALRGQDAPPATPPAAHLIVYIGTYAEAEESGIHVCQLDLTSGVLTRTGGVAGLKHPSFQALHPNGQFLYSVSEVQDYQGQPAGAVAALAIEPRTGQLTLLNSQSSMGAGPCHVTVDASARHVLAANYGSGSVVVLPIAADGRLEMACAFVQHQGSSVHARQQGPHAHCIHVDPTGRFVLSADLGLDQVVIYRYDSQAGSLTPNAWQAAATMTPGAGPRHLAFHPNGRFCYVINELACTVTVLAYRSETGELSTVQEITTLPADFQGENTTAEIAVSPDGRFLYGSNRGHHSIAVFAIDPTNGQLTPVSHHATLGQTPRNFGIDPTGTWLLAANQRTNNVVVFRIDRTTGKLEPTGHQLEVPKPVCVTFLSMRAAVGDAQDAR
jgi:6-phosphogluconolactonase